MSAPTLDRISNDGYFAYTECVCSKVKITDKQHYLIVMLKAGLFMCGQPQSLTIAEYT